MKWLIGHFITDEVKEKLLLICVVCREADASFVNIHFFQSERQREKERVRERRVESELEETLLGTKAILSRSCRQLPLLSLSTLCLSHLPSISGCLSTIFPLLFSSLLLFCHFLLLLNQTTPSARHKLWDATIKALAGAGSVGVSRPRTCRAASGVNERSPWQQRRRSTRFT